MRFLSFLVVGATLSAQVPDNKSLSGKYFFRELSIASDTSEVNSIYGTLTFDGNGVFSFQGQQLTGTNGPVSASGSGTYSVSSSGMVTFPDPLRKSTPINVRLGVGALVGSNTETGSTLFDLLIAIPAPALNATNSALSGNYWIATLELPSGSLANVRDGFVQANANSTGGLGTVAITGEISGAGFVTQTAPGSTYSLNADGSGTANFPAPASADASGLVLTGTKSIYVSQDGSLFIGGGATAGAQGIIVGIKAGPSPTNATLNGIYFGGGINTSAPISAFVRAATSKGDSNIVLSRRYLQNCNSQPLNVSAINNYIVNSGSGGFMLSDSLAISNSNFLIASGVQPDTTTRNFDLHFAVRKPPMSGAGVFLNPLGVFNAASYAPAGFPISGGELITLYGTGFPAQTAVATTLPLPVTIGGVQVLINGTAVPMFSITSDHVSAMVP